jgi:hypothetical protein
MNRNRRRERQGHGGVSAAWLGALFLPAFGVVVAGCGTARVVQRNPSGGVVALQGDRNLALQKAHQQMAGHCGPGAYRILQEGEEVVGSETQGKENTAATKEGGTVTRTGSETRNVTEWRIQYECSGSAPPAYYGSQFQQPPPGSYPPGQPAYPAPQQPYPPAGPQYPPATQPGPYAPAPGGTGPGQPYPVGYPPPPAQGQPAYPPPANYPPPGYPPPPASGK